MKIGVICAFKEEIELLSEKMTGVTVKTLHGIEVTSGEIAGHAVSLCISGIGKANAAATTQFVISAIGCDRIINIGLAGNCSDSLHIGNAVVANKLVYHDYNMDWAAESAPFVTHFTPDFELAGVAKAVLEKHEIPYVEGTVATGDQFIMDGGIKKDIVGRTGCSCVEMEAGAIAHIAQKNKIPYTIIKIISDNAEESGSDEFHETLSIGGYCAVSSDITADIVASL